MWVSLTHCSILYQVISWSQGSLKEVEEVSWRKCRLDTLTRNTPTRCRWRERQRLHTKLARLLFSYNVAFWALGVRNRGPRTRTPFREPYYFLCYSRELVWLGVNNGVSFLVRKSCRDLQKLFWICVFQNVLFGNLRTHLGKQHLLWFFLLFYSNKGVKSVFLVGSSLQS